MRKGVHFNTELRNTTQGYKAFLKKRYNLNKAVENNTLKYL